MNTRSFKTLLCAACLGASTVVALSGCAATGDTVQEASSAVVKQSASASASDQATSTPASKVPTAVDIEITQTDEDATDGGHAILADGEQASLEHAGVKKTGESSGDEADFYGENGLIPPEDVVYRKNSIRNFRMQRTFDNVFNVTEKKE